MAQMIRNKKVKLTKKKLRFLSDEITAPFVNFTHKATDETTPLVNYDADVVEAPEVKKTSDKMIVPGGRISRYWNSHPIKKNAYTSNKPTDMKVYTDVVSFVEHFKLNSVEFGNWMSQKDRFQFLYAGADSLHQLAKMIGVPDSYIGMNRKLSVSFGARGNGGRVAATYEPSPYAVINITKPHITSGSFAHEFAHAVDNLIAFYYHKENHGFASAGHTTAITIDIDRIKAGGFGGLAEYIFSKLYWINDNEKTQFALDLIENTREGTKSDYWIRRNEVWARTFEVIAGKELGRNNKMLSKGVISEGSWAYPNTSIVNKIRNEMLDFFKNAISWLNGEIVTIKSFNVTIDKEKIETPERTYNPPQEVYITPDKQLEPAKPDEPIGPSKEELKKIHKAEKQEKANAMKKRAEELRKEREEKALKRKEEIAKHKEARKQAKTNKADKQDDLETYKQERKEYKENMTMKKRAEELEREQKEKERKEAEEKAKSETSKKTDSDDEFKEKLRKKMMELLDD